MTSNTIHPFTLREQSTTVLGRLQDQGLVGYRRLALQLHHDLKPGHISRSVMVVSPNDAGTCAMVAANLACCMAEELGREILLADATREGMLSAALVESIPHGLNNFLSNPELSLDSLVLPTSFAHVSFLPCGSRTAGYGPENSAKLLAASAGRFAFVVVAAGAILNDPFAFASAPAFGTTVMIVVENETPTRMFEEAAHSLEMCGVENIRLTLVERSAA